MPKYPELSAQKALGCVQDSPQLMMYIPVLNPGKLSERTFIMGILSTIRGEKMKKID